MKVSLISSTTFLPGDDNPSSHAMSAEELIVYTARVSNPSNQMNMETAPKLIKYLIAHKHWSPFEMAHMTVAIETSRGIAQQILRHRSFSFQEFSQRYSAAPGLEPLQLRKQADKNRQSSSSLLDANQAAELNSKIKKLFDHTTSLYEDMLQMGVAKECARFILPITTQTKLYMCGSARSWIHYLQLRLKADTQLEHRVIAEEIARIFNSQFPHTAEALNYFKEEAP